MRLFRAVTYFILLFLTANAAAGERAGRIRYGIEWGYTGTVYESHDYAYLSDAGAMVAAAGHSLIFNSNGCFMAFAGYEFMGKTETDLVSGYVGVIQGRRVVPLMVRETYFFNGCRNDGIKVFAEGGACLSGTFRDKPSWMGRAGAGYRVMLGDIPAMDLFISAHFVQDHPASVYASEYSYSVPKSDLRSSLSQYAGISIGLALNF